VHPPVAECGAVDGEGEVVEVSAPEDRSDCAIGEGGQGGRGELEVEHRRTATSSLTTPLSPPHAQSRTHARNPDIPLTQRGDQVSHKRLDQRVEGPTNDDGHQECDGGGFEDEVLVLGCDAEEGVGLDRGKRARLVVFDRSRDAGLVLPFAPANPDSFLFSLNCL